MVNIICELVNLSSVSDSVLHKIVEVASMPNSYKVLLVVGEEDFNDNFGETVPREFVDVATDTALRKKEYSNKEWDIGIVLYKQACKIYETYPALFVYLLGHEVGHAKCCSENSEMHPFYCLIQQDIGEASNGMVKYYHELPHEIRCDQIGKYIAERICGATLLKANIKRYPQNMHGFERILSLDSTDQVGILFDELKIFANPYKKELNRALIVGQFGADY